MPIFNNWCGELGISALTAAIWLNTHVTVHVPSIGPMLRVLLQNLISTSSN